MAVVTRVPAGGVVPITFNVRKVADDDTDGQRQRTNGARVTITNPSGTVIVNAGSPTFAQKGSFTYYWNTAGLAVGDYKVAFTSGVGFNTVAGTVQNKMVRTRILRLVAIL